MPRKRAPDGVVTTSPVALRLMPDELNEIKLLAEKEQRPLSNLCRLLVLRSLDDFKRKQAALNAI